MVGCRTIYGRRYDNKSVLDNGIWFTIVSAPFRAYRTNRLGTTSEFIMKISICQLNGWMIWIWHGLDLVACLIGLIADQLAV